MLNNKKIVILGGGTNTYISNHLALSAPAYGTTAKTLANKFRRHEENKMEVDLYLTKMASSDSMLGIVLNMREMSSERKSHRGWLWGSGC